MPTGFDEVADFFHPAGVREAQLGGVLEFAGDFFDRLGIRHLDFAGLALEDVQGGLLSGFLAR